MKTVGQLIEELKAFDPALPVVIQDSEYMTLDTPQPHIQYKDPDKNRETLYDTPTTKYFNHDAVGENDKWYEVTLTPVVVLL